MEKQRRVSRTNTAMAGSVEDQLDVLKSLLKDVFLPLEMKNV